MGTNRTGIRRTNWLARATAGGGAALVVMLFVTSVAAGATMVPPYKGSVVSNYNSQSSGGCKAVGKNVAPAGWSSVTGIGHLAEAASAKSCAKSLAGIGGSSSGYASGEFEIAIPVKIGSTGTHSVSPTWMFTLADSQAMSVGGKCPAVKISATGYGSSYCDASAEAYISGYAYFVDITNGTYFYSSNYWSGFFNYSSQYNDTYCYNFNCSYYNSSYGAPSSFSGSTSHTWWFNGTMVKTHHYVLITYVYGGADAYLYGYPASSATASVNLATLGNGAKLTSISVT